MHRTCGIYWQITTLDSQFSDLGPVGCGEGSERITIFMEEAGVISDKSLWCCYANCRLFTGYTIDELLSEMYCEWDDEKHLAM